MSRIVVVGAGIGGLVAAIDLARAGNDVTVLERAAHVGGKAHAVDVGGAWVDTGPTVLTMRWVFDELFEDAGRTLGAYANLSQAQILARHAWADGSRLDLHADPEATAEAIARFADRAEADRYRAFAKNARATYETVESTFMTAQRPTLASLVRMKPIDLRGLARIDAHRTMWSALGRSFRDPRLRQLFARYATYCGASPFDAPATFNLVAHVESMGVWRVRGGVSALASALAKLAGELGVVVRCDAEVTEVRIHHRADGVRLRSGEVVEADAVVVNADVASVAAGRLGTRAVRSVAAEGTRSLSAVTWAIAGRARGFPLVHHSVFFSDDYRAEFDDILRKERAPSAPTIYVCAQDRADAGAARDEERFLVIMNAPATGDRPERWSEVEKRRCEHAAFETMARCGLTLTPRASAMSTPVDFAARFPATGGALYGPRARGAFSSLKREGAKTETPGLYLAGGSVHPGPGVPMAAISGRLAAKQIAADLASTARSRRTVINGTTSTA